ARRKASPEDLFDFARDRADLGHSIDRAEDPAITVIREDRRRLTMVDFKTRLDRLRPVVGAAGEFASTAAIADPVDFRPMVSFVIAGATLLAAEAPGQAINQCDLVDLELDDMVELEAVAREHLVQRPGLRQRPRKAVENKAVAAIRLANAVGNHVDHDAIGNELAGIHDALDAQSDLASGSGRRAQHVPGG